MLLTARNAGVFFDPGKTFSSFFSDTRAILGRGTYLRSESTLTQSQFKISRSRDKGLPQTQAIPYPSDSLPMRLLALAAALLSGAAVSLGIGEFEAKIDAAPSIAEKVALAEQAFESVTGFVPREYFMSYWSIDALSGIADAYKAIKQSEGVVGLVPEYANIARICTMEMGDYRYFFEPLKAELDTLIAAPATGSESHFESLSNPTPAVRNLFPAWSTESINSLIEFWHVSGAIEKSLEIEGLLLNDWSRSDIEFWDLLYSEFQLRPAQIVVAMKMRLQFHDWEPNPAFVASLLTQGDPLNSFPAIAFQKSEISEVGPRLH